MIGCLVPPPPWTGRVAGAFDRAISIVHPDGAIVSVIAGPGQLEARAMLPSAGWTEFSDTARRLAASDTTTSAVWNGLTLALFAATENSKACSNLDFSGHGIWDLKIRHQAPTPAGPVLSALAATTIESFLVAARLRGRPLEGIHGDGAFGKAFGRLRATDGFPVNIVGFGPGTTSAEQALRTGLARRLHMTTPAGRSLLLGALAGIPPAYLGGLARATESYIAAACQGDEAEIGDATASMLLAVQTALGHGATSGEDAITGFIEGLNRRTDTSPGASGT